MDTKRFELDLDLNITNLPATILVDRIRKGKLSSRQVVSAFLENIARLNPDWNAIVSLRDEADILVEADLADHDLANGKWHGPIHGLPIAVKDLALTKGLRTTFGSPLYRDFVPDHDSLIVERMRAAGGLVIGKTNVPEGGLGSHTYNRVFGLTRNAWDPTKSAGGSSGGAAVAVALRLLPFADGSDMGGSLRNPAAFNGIFGLRPSLGRVPFWPRTDAFWSQHVTEGPIARSAADLTLLLSVLAGPDARVPLSLTDDISDWHRRLDVDMQGKKIAWLADLPRAMPFEDGITDLCRSSLDCFMEAGVEIVEIDSGLNWEAIWTAFKIQRQFSIGRRFEEAFEDPRRRRLMKPELIWEIECSKKLTMTDLHKSVETRTHLYDRFMTLHQTFDYLSMPSAQVFAFPSELHWPTEIDGIQMDSYHRWMQVVTAGTLSGCPCLSVPAGYKGGLPMGVQLIGRRWDDLSLLQAARTYEKLVDYLRDLPPVLQCR